MSGVVLHGFLPAGAHASLLRAALLDGDAAISAWRTWRRTVDFDRVDQASYRLVPLLYRNLERLRVDDPFVGTLRGIYRRTWCENQLLFRRLARVVTDLRAAGIETLVLKGAALASQAYGDAGARSMADVDLLVRERDFAAARERLLRAAWVPREDNAAAWDASRERFFADLGTLQFRQDGDALYVLDLHASVLKLFSHGVVPFPEERLWADAEAFDLLGVPARRLSPAHQLLHVCFHGLQRQRLPSVRWVADAHLLVRARGDRLDWGRLLRDARRHRVVAPLKEALELLAADWGTAVPRAVLRALRGTAVSLVERVERPIRHGAPRGRTDYAKTLSPVLRRVAARERLRVRPVAALRAAHKLFVRLPVKHGIRRPLERWLVRGPARAEGAAPRAEAVLGPASRAGT